MTLLLSPELFPSIGMLALMKSASEVVLEYQDHFPKQTLRNRYYILTSQGSTYQTVPVVKRNKTLSKEVRISYEQNWPSQHWEGINAAYGKSAFWEHFQAPIKEWLFTEYTFLYEMQFAALTICLSSLSLKVPISHTVEYYTDQQEVQGWLNARDVIGKESFERIPFIVPYKQCFEGFVGSNSEQKKENQTFVPGLSFIDLLFCTGPAANNYIPKYDIQIESA